MIALLSLISRAAFSERSDEYDDCGNFLLGEVRVPASRETILYANGSRGGFFDLRALAASSVRAHLDMDRRRAYGIVGVDELELVVSERRGESSAETGTGTVSRRGRSISMRWGSSETDRLSGGCGLLIERASLREGTTSVVILFGGAVARGTFMTAIPSYSQLLHPLFSFSTQNHSEFPILRTALDDVSRELASNKSLRSFRQRPSVPQTQLTGVSRIQLGSQAPSIWKPLHEVWDSVTRVQSAGIGLDSQHTQLVLSLAKFTRNLVADVPFNQKNAL